jgi:hypothetical protein
MSIACREPSFVDSFFLILVSLRVNEFQFCDFGFPLTATTNGKWKMEDGGQWVGEAVEGAGRRTLPPAE